LETSGQTGKTDASSNKEFSAERDNEAASEQTGLSSVLGDRAGPGGTQLPGQTHSGQQLQAVGAGTGQSVGRGYQK